MIDSCFELQEDLSGVFGRNYYRLSSLNYVSIRDDLAGLDGPNIVVAQLWGEDAYNAKILGCLGFQKISLLALLARDLTEGSSGRGAPPTSGLDLDGAVLDRHALNLRLNGLAFDPRITEETVVAFNRRRLEQALRASDALHFVDEDGLLVFKPEDHPENGSKVTLDLFSVLSQRKGLGTALAHQVFDWAWARGTRRIEVSTECENVPALLFYQKCGFRLTRTVAIFHRHAGAQAAMTTPTG